jgi:hypothetical protein
MFIKASLLYYAHAIDRLTVQRNQLIHEIEDRQERLIDYNNRLDALRKKLRQKQR